MKNKIFAALTVVTLLATSGCSNNTPTDYCVVHFDTNSTIETNVIEDQKVNKGEKIYEPAVVIPRDPSIKKRVSGWYLNKEYSSDKKWDFDTNTVSSSFTLYAKWADLITVSYYLQGSSSPIWTVSNACLGEPLEQHDELCDGYEFLGYFSDSECTQAFDLTKPLTVDTNVYMKRTETLNINPSAIKRRFSPIAASGAGSTAGSIGAAGKDEKGDDYVDVDFGYSTSADPYIQITNPVLNISKSQVLEFKFKNLGDASSISLYWVSKLSDGNYAGGITYYSQTNYYNIKLSESERNMSETDEWITKTIKISDVLINGVSSWGNSVSLIKWRIQAGYNSKTAGEKAVPNVIRFNSIKGISDESYVGFNDSEAISKMKVDASSEELEKASKAQEEIQANINGMIFPRANEYLETSRVGKYYKKTDGLLLYCNYGDTLNKYVFKMSETGKTINAEDYSYLKLYLSNYSYVTKLTVSIETIDAKGTTKITNGTFELKQKNTTNNEYYLNLYEKTNMVGTINKVTFSFDYNGVDNAILLHKFEFTASKPYTVPGFNFNDKNHAGFSNTETMTLERDSHLGATYFTSLADESITEMHLDYNFDSSLYSYLIIDFYHFDEDNITSIDVCLKINDEYQINTFEDIVADDSEQTFVLPYSDGGVITDAKIVIHGKGKIAIRKIEFDLDEEVSLDLSDQYTYNNMMAQWKDGLNFSTDQSCAVNTKNGSIIQYYFGNRYQNKVRDYGNICMGGKTRIYIIYQKLSTDTTDTIGVKLYGLDRNQVKEYDTAVGSDVLMDSKYLTLIPTQNENSWNIGYLDLDLSYCEDNYYLSQINFWQSPGAKTDVKIRGLVIK